MKLEEDDGMVIVHFEWEDNAHDNMIRAEKWIRDQYISEFSENKSD